MIREKTTTTSTLHHTVLSLASHWLMAVNLRRQGPRNHSQLPQRALMTAPRCPPTSRGVVVGYVYGLMSIVKEVWTMNTGSAKCLVSIARQSPRLSRA